MCRSCCDWICDKRLQCSCINIPLNLCLPVNNSRVIHLPEVTLQDSRHQPSFPITTVPLILRYSRFIVNIVTGVFIKRSAEPRGALRHNTGPFVNLRSVRVPLPRFTVSLSGRGEGGASVASERWKPNRVALSNLRHERKHRWQAAFSCCRVCFE